MKNLTKQEIVKLVNVEIESDLKKFGNLNNLLWEYGYESSYGHYSAEYHIKNGTFSQEVYDYVINEGLDSEFYDTYSDWQFSAATEDLTKNPEEYAHIEDEDEKFECAMESSDGDGFIWGGFLNYIITCIYLVLDDTEELEDKLYESDYDFVYETDDKYTAVIDIEDAQVFLYADLKNKKYSLEVLYDYDSEKSNDNFDNDYETLDELLEAGKVYLELELV